MESPFVATVVHGVTEGVINLRGHDTSSPRWWAGFQLRYRETQRRMRAERLRGPDTPEYVKAVEPWEIQSQASDDLDLVTRWFMMYEPEKLKALGVDLDSLKR